MKDRKVWEEAIVVEGTTWAKAERWEQKARKEHMSKAIIGGQIGVEGRVCYIGPC